MAGGATAQERRERQKERVNSVARRLLAASGECGTLDASYLLAPGPAHPADPAPPSPPAPALVPALPPTGDPVPAPPGARPPRAARRPRRLPPRSS
ncbi:hypothetical protein RR46_09654 [Papilio xuthus]|uniref:Uncharacterized protein n=1 Tax=Papilio xuthus TaxID=66420 RepID=A0A194PZH3_PAPXU|nr:hypothetical protein RR46_09654 [Papilio xuthus]